jgi:hypothetical protein
MPHTNKIALGLVAFITASASSAPQDSNPPIRKPSEQSPVKIDHGVTSRPTDGKGREDPPHTSGGEPVGPIEAAASKRALVQVTVVDSQGQRRRGVPVNLRRSLEGRPDIEEVTATDEYGIATISLRDLSEAETVRVGVTNTDARLIRGNAIDADGIVTVDISLKPDAPVKGLLADPIPPRRDYSPTLTQILRSKDQHLRVPTGEDCDVPLPATQAPSDFLIYQIVRRPNVGKTPSTNLGSIKPMVLTLSAAVPKGVLFGDRVIYRQTWRLLGQSLGDLIYSLPLAPLESVNLAIVEWSREDLAQRAEDTIATESLLHSQFRDRSVIETVSTAISEYQGGFSIIGAAAGVGGPTVGAIGGGTSHSWGNRDLVGESVQQLSDSVQQASEVVRSQTSTVVIQASQAEHDLVQTRTISNYNQNHALTIQYYEVLRHFEIVTAFETVEPILLVPFQPLTFDREIALRFRRILERTALDSRIHSWLDASERLGYSGNYFDAPAAPIEDDDAPATAPVPRFIDSLRIKYVTGDQETIGPVFLELGLRNQQFVRIDTVKKAELFKPTLQKNSELVVERQHQSNMPPLDLASIQEIRVTWQQGGIGDGWKFKGIEIHYALEGGNGFESEPLYSEIAIDPQVLKYFVDKGSKSWSSRLFNPPQPAGAQATGVNKGSPPAVAVTKPSTGGGRFIGGDPSVALHSEREKRQRADDAAQELLLLEHLNANRLQYSRAVVLQMDGDDRVRLLEVFLNDTDLLRDIDFEPVGTSGSYVAFPYRGTRAPKLEPAVLANLQKATPQTRHVNLPTRGVFAEANLSHCPAREERDPSRMYSPGETILPAAPAITGIQPGSRNDQLDTTPTPLPAPVVSIQSPAPAPDPAGLAAAFALLGQMGPFRDMSTSREVGNLLGQLASGAISGDAVAPAAQRIQQALVAGAGSDPRPHPAITGSPQEIADRMTLLDKTDVPAAEKTRIRQNLIDPGPAPQASALRAVSFQIQFLNMDGGPIAGRVGINIFPDFGSEIRLADPTNPSHVLDDHGFFIDVANIQSGVSGGQAIVRLRVQSDDESVVFELLGSGRFTISGNVVSIRVQIASVPVEVTSTSAAEARAKRIRQDTATLEASGEAGGDLSGEAGEDAVIGLDDLVKLGENALAKIALALKVKLGYSEARSITVEGEAGVSESTELKFTVRRMLFALTVEQVNRP